MKVPRLRKSTVDVITDQGNNVFVSKVSLFEIVIKQSIGKLKMSKTPEEIVGLLKENHFVLLEIETSHFSKYLSLPLLHRDPFDRLLIAQAINENFTIITDDKQISLYDVKTIIQ